MNTTMIICSFICLIAGIILGLGVMLLINSKHIYQLEHENDLLKNKLNQNHKVQVIEIIDPTARHSQKATDFSELFKPW